MNVGVINLPFRLYRSILGSSSITRIYVVMKSSITALTVFMFFICFSSFGQVNTQQIQFQDCTYIDFGEIDYSTMTEAEKIQAMDNALFDALDNTEECMKSAITSGAQGVASASNSGRSSSSSQGESSTAQNSDQESIPSQQDVAAQHETQVENASPSKQSHGGPAKSGSSVVCDAVYEGLEGAKSESQKEHFQKLKDQYGC